ncbi:MAG: trigger factor [bacterium (Candidatus Stahlbacteria) CG23_combo_of_CG06-09_8_20_14_all_34_7]|nr:MAG: trigger factor [bacterium (Candidatus Stahlbacteria) CG23_combo_of_CG06-09_8_20_14_all_34_7]
MNYTTSISDKWRITIQVSFTNDEFLAEYNNKLEDAKKSAKIDGFRQGKAPVNLIEQKYKKNIEDETEEKLIKSALITIINEKNLNPLSKPYVKKVENKNEKILCEIEFDIFPEKDISDYSEIKINLKKKEVTDEIVERKINEIRNIYAKIEEKDGSLEKQDIAIIDISVFDFDGKEIEDIKYSDYSVEITDGKILPVFIENLIGKKKGDEFEFFYKYPDDYDDKLLKGKDVKIKIKIKETKKKILITDNEEFVKKLGFKSYLEIFDMTKRQIEIDFDRDFEFERDKLTMNNLIEKNQFEVPETLILMHFEAIVNSLRKQGKEKIKDDQKMKEIYINYAIWRAKREVILHAIAHQEKIKAEDEEIQKQIDEIKKHPDLKVRNMASSEEIRDDIEKDIIFMKVRDLINSRIIYEKKGE